MKIGATAAPAATPATDADKLKKAAAGFEAVFLRQMIGSMRQAKLADDDIFGSSAEDQFRDMGDAKLADDMAGKGAFGVSELLTRQFGKAAPAPAVSSKA